MFLRSIDEGNERLDDNMDKDGDIVDEDKSVNLLSIDTNNEVDNSQESKDSNNRDDVIEKETEDNVNDPNQTAEVQKKISCISSQETINPTLSWTNS